MISATRTRIDRFRASVCAPAFALAALACPAAAQSPWSGGAPPWAAMGSDAGSTVVQELDINKRLPGPALWKVSKGASQVIILGALAPLPHLLNWDTTRVQHALDGADVLLMSPRPRLGFFDTIAMILNKGALQLPRDQTLTGVLSPTARERFLKLLGEIHKDPKAYARWKPAVAGFILISDWRRAVGLSEGKPGTTVVKLAEAQHVPIKYVGDFNVVPYVKSLTSLSMAANLVCFDAALDDVERESALAPKAARAWADADLKTVRTSYSVSVFERCMMQVPSIQGLFARGSDEGVRVIDDALSKPGKAVAVIDLNFLLRANGILDRLKAKGDAVSTPRE